MLTNYCRICLTSIGVVHQLDEVVHKTLSLHAMLCKMYPEAFTDNNEPQWPRRVCGVCKQAVLDAYRLYTVCMASFEVFKEQMKNELKTNPLRADTELLVTCNFVSGIDEVDTKEAVIIIDDDENDEHYLSSDQEDGFKAINGKMMGKERENLETSTLNERPSSPVAVQPTNAKRNKVVRESAPSFKNEILELQIEMDCSTQRSNISVQEDHLDDLEGSMECFDDAEDSVHFTGYHETVENDERPVVMPKVSDSVVNSESWKELSDESEEEEAFTEICSSKLFSYETRHKATHGKHLENHSMDFMCKMCNEGFESATALNAHESTHESPTLCWICGITLTSAKHHKMHMLSHKPEEIQACHLCPLRFNSKPVLRAHLLTHQKQNLCCCDICGMNLSSKRNLKYHQQAVHGEGVEKMFICNICDRRFALPYYLKSHMNSHTGVRPYSCVFCNRVYGKGGDLVEHVAKHHVGNDNIYQCHLCDSDFSKIRELRSHYEVHYRNGEKFNNEILTDFGKFRFTIKDLLKMRQRKEKLKIASILLPKP